MLIVNSSGGVIGRIKETKVSREVPTDKCQEIAPGMLFVYAGQLFVRGGDRSAMIEIEGINFGVSSIYAMYGERSGDDMLRVLAQIAGVRSFPSAQRKIVIIGSLEYNQFTDSVTMQLR
jgi:hypothetical protein